MPRTVAVNKKSEFFISIVKDGLHSFLMLGVMVDGRPNLLASIGKGNLIDKSYGTSVIEQIGLFKKALCDHTEAFLKDEGISDSEDAIADISYQSYSITYEQYKEFLALTKEIHKDQLEHYRERIRVHPEKEYRNLSYPEKGVRNLKIGIGCFVPTQEDEEQITLTYQNLDSYEVEPRAVDSTRKEIIDGACTLHVSNTCRTTACSILNYTLGYTPSIPALFAVDLNYKNKLVAGVPCANTFYILPPPPKSFDVKPAQMKTLEELYKRLENIPKTKSNSPITREKFDAIKELYQKIAGTPQLSLVELLDQITIHRIEHSHLFDRRRAQSIISQFVEAIGLKVPTDTEKAYARMEKMVHQEIKRLNEAPAELQASERRPPTVSL